MTQHVIVGELGELHFRNQLRPDPVYAFSLGAGWWIDECRAADLERLQPPGHLLQQLLIESCADAARVAQLIAIVHAEQERPESRARTARVREAANHELLATDAL